MRWARREEGSILVLAAVGMLPLLLVAVFVVDVGNWWGHKRHIQLQVDSSAFGGGDAMGACFNPAAGKTVVYNTATTYYGLNPIGGQFGSADQGSEPSPPVYNQNLPNDPDPIPASSVDNGGGPLTGPCASPYVFDVRTTESGLPLFFGSLPGFSSVNVTGHARVQLFQAGQAPPNFPLAFPSDNPTHVWASVYNLSTGGSLTPPVSLNGPDTSGPLDMWGPGTAPFTMPSNGTSNVGVRIGVGSAVTDCSGTVTGGSGYACYPQDGPAIVIHNYSTTTSRPSNWGSNPPGVLRQVTESTCSGSPFFSDVNGSSCAASVTAIVDWPSSCPTNYKCETWVTGNDTHSTAESSHIVYTGSIGAGSSYTLGFSYPNADGQEPVTLSWNYKMTKTTSGNCSGGGPNACPPGYNGGNPASGAFPNAYHQSAYSADSDLDVTGPVKSIAFSCSGCTGGGPTSSSGSSSPTFTINVGLQPGLSRTLVPPNCSTAGTPACTPVVVRAQSKNFGSAKTNHTTVITCTDKNGNNDVKDAFSNAAVCNNFKLNTGTPCPDGISPPAALDCADVKGGDLGNSFVPALNQRFASCPPVVWPPTDPSDPRIVQIIITNQSDLSQSGHISVPVVQFGGLYVTGWGAWNGNSWDLGCPGVNIAPNQIPGLCTRSCGGQEAIWGYWMEAVKPEDTGDPSKNCTGNFIVCVATLIR